MIDNHKFPAGRFNDCCVLFEPLAAEPATDKFAAFDGRGGKELSFVPFDEMFSFVKDYLGSLSDYAECLVEQEKEDDTSSTGPADEEKKESYKESKQERDLD